MKHSFWLTILSLFVAVSCVEQSADLSDRAPRRCGWHEYMPKLRGEVDSVAVVVTESEILMRYKYTYKFNERGDVEQWSSFYGDGRSYDKRIYKYDSEGRNTELAWYRDEGPFWQTVRYKYDEQGNMVESCESTDYAVLNRELCKYDVLGRLSEVAFGDGEDGSFGRIIYKYDTEGRKIEKIAYTSSGTIDNKECYFYDANGNDAGYDLYDEDGNIKSSERYGYDSKGNRIEVSGDSYRRQYQYKYDAQDNVVECKEYDAKNKTLLRTAEFDIYYRQR